MGRGGLRWGRRHLSVENCHSISAWGHFQWSPSEYDEGFECKWDSEDGGVILRYKIDGDGYTDRIALTETLCHFGGSRTWLVCSCCGRRVGKLYLPTNLYYGGRRVNRWLCRHCYQLTYEQRRAGNSSFYFECRVDRHKALLQRHGITQDAADTSSPEHRPAGQGAPRNSNPGRVAPEPQNTQALFRARTPQGSLPVSQD